MKRTVLGFPALLAVALSAAAVHGRPQPPASDPPPEMSVGRRANPCLRLRSGASVDRAVLDCLEAGTRLRVLGNISGWSHVRLTDGREGWVDATYLTPAPPPPADPPPAQAATTTDPASDLGPQIRALEGHLRAAAARREAMEDRLQKTVAAAEEAQLEAGRLRDRIAQLEAAAAPGGSAESLAAELEAGRARVTELEGLLAASESRLLRAVELNAEQERRIEALDAALADAERKVAEAELRVRLADRSEPVPVAAAESPVRVRSPIVPAPEPPRVSVREPAAEAEVASQPLADDPDRAIDAAIDAVRAWAAAWSDQRVDDYLASYAPEFQPPDGLGREAWEAQRRQRLTRPSFIRVTISALTAELADDGTVTATFRQEYESNAFADVVTKELTLIEKDGVWRLAAETARP